MADADGQDSQLENTRTETQQEGLDWMFPFLGAIGFGIGFAYSCAIGATTFDVIKNEIAFIFPGTEVDPVYGVIRGVIVGAAGGVGLGLAFKNLKRTLNFALVGTVAFASAFAYVLSVDISTVPEVLQNVIRTMLRIVGSNYYFYFEPALGRGLVTGSIVGIVGGFALGLAVPQPTIKPALWLALAGGLWFAIAFAIEAVLFNGDRCTSWNGWGGALGGAILGLTLAQYNKIQAKKTAS